GTAQQVKSQNERTQKLAGGSRFNLRYPNGVDPDDVTPSAVAHALEEYATLPADVAPPSVNTTSLAAAPPATQSSDPGPAEGEEARKGMSSTEVAAILGSSTSNIVNGAVTTNRYHGATGAIEVDFVNDVAVAVRKIPSTGSNALRKGLSEADVE